MNFKLNLNFRESLTAIALIFASSIVMSLTVVTLSAHKTMALAASPVGTSMSYTNGFYAYVEAGQNVDVSFTKMTDGVGNTDPSSLAITIFRPGAANVTCNIGTAAPAGTTCDELDLTAPTTGIWGISAQTANLGLPGSTPTRFTWQIGVQNGTTDVPGRVWSTLYQMSQLDSADATTTASPAFWYQSDNGYTYRATYMDFDGVISNFAASKTGSVLKDTCTPLYRSAEFTETTVADFDTNIINTRCGGQYKLFYEQPAADLPASGTRWDGNTTWILPPIAEPTISGVSYAQSTTGSRAGSLNFSVGNYTGVASVRVDVNNNGSFSDPIDRTIPITIDGPTISVPFDGLDGNGNIIPDTQKLTFNIAIDRTAEIHFVNADVETRAGGLEVERVNGPMANRTTLFWNDTTLDTNRCSTTSILNGLAGINSVGGVHAWTNLDGLGVPCPVSGPDRTITSWGNERYIDDWAFAPVNVTSSLLLREYPLIEDPAPSAPNSGIHQKYDFKALGVVLTIVIGVILLFVSAIRRQKSGTI